jgi:hypothetical protein
MKIKPTGFYCHVNKYLFINAQIHLSPVHQPQHQMKKNLSEYQIDNVGIAAEQMNKI